MTTGLSDHYDRLAEADPVLARLIGRYGHPDPFAWHDGGRTGSDLFSSLVLHIVGQRISAIVAFRVFDRIAAARGGRPTPAGLIELGEGPLREAGLSQAKAGYLLSLARGQVAGTIDFESISALDDDRAIAALTAVSGIGLWTAQTFLIHQLHRDDILPAAEIGVRKAVRVAWDLRPMPTAAQVEAMGEKWAPHRSYATALLWRSLYPVGEPSDQKERALIAMGEGH